MLSRATTFWTLHSRRARVFSKSKSCSSRRALVSLLSRPLLRQCLRWHLRPLRAWLVNHCKEIHVWNKWDFQTAIYRLATKSNRHRIMLLQLYTLKVSSIKRSLTSSTSSWSKLIFTCTENCWLKRRILNLWQLLETQLKVISFWTEIPKCSIKFSSIWGAIESSFQSPRKIRVN